MFRRADLGKPPATSLCADSAVTEKDIIYKIDYAKSLLFVRFLYHVDNGAWRLFRIRLKVEMDEAFPKDWLHIY